MARTYRFEDLEGEYARRWNDMVVTPGRVGAIDKVARKIISGKARYLAVERETGVPWAIVGVLHNREAGCDFAGVLHNGEQIIGTGRKTKLVPKGRGPFTTWHEAALDALRIKGYGPGFPWSVERFLFESERFNGFGYRVQGVPSAYLWSYTNQYTKGKFIRDHVWDANAVDQQIGVAPLMLRLMVLDPSISFGPAPAAPVDIGGVVVDDGLSAGEVRAVQQRLRDLGYSEVGRVDGLWGPRSTAAVSAFQSTVGLPVTGALDKTTAAALTTSGPRPVAKERAEVTAKDLREAGDKTAKASWWSKLWAWLLGAPTLAVGVAQQTDAASGYLATAKTLLGDVPGFVWVALLVGVAIALYVQAQRTETALVADVRSGRDAGPA